MTLKMSKVGELTDFNWFSVSMPRQFKWTDDIFVVMMMFGNSENGYWGLTTKNCMLGWANIWGLQTAAQ